MVIAAKSAAFASALAACACMGLALGRALSSAAPRQTWAGGMPATQTVLAFYTAAPAKVRPGQSVTLGTVATGAFGHIRVDCDERLDSPSGVTIMLLITRPPGRIVVSHLDDIRLSPRSWQTRAYTTPGQALTVVVVASRAWVPSSGTDAIDLEIYGRP